MRTQIETTYLSKRRTAILNNEMYKHNRDNAFLCNAEKQAITIFNPLTDYQKELQEIYKAVLQSIGIDYNTYVSRHNISKAGN